MITVDHSRADAGLRRISSGLSSAPARVGLQQAAVTARAIRGRVPVRSGRLRSTVTVDRRNDGGEVHYGGLPYAGYIEGRTHAVEEGAAAGRREFAVAMRRAAEEEISRA